MVDLRRCLKARKCELVVTKWGEWSTVRERTKTECSLVAEMASVMVRPNPPVPPAIATRDMV